jgi:hypothetical protein
MLVRQVSDLPEGIDAANLSGDGGDDVLVLRPGVVVNDEFAALLGALLADTPNRRQGPATP